MTGVTTRYDRVVTEALRPLRPLRKRGRNSNGGNETFWVSCSRTHDLLLFRSKTKVVTEMITPRTDCSSTRSRRSKRPNSYEHMLIKQQVHRRNCLISKIDVRRKVRSCYLGATDSIIFRMFGVQTAKTGR
jgi:hypothetical protein